jgi:lipoprotein-releasing system permease protein
LNYELFIAKRIVASKQFDKSVSAPIIKIAIFAIAIGMVIMMISISTGLGLQQKIREKLSGFNGHIQITNFDNNNSEITLVPLSINQEFYPEFKSVEGINAVQIYATKVGIIRTESDFEGIILKGVSGDYNWDFFTDYLVEGVIPDFGTKLSFDILISREIANRLRVGLGDQVNILFVKEDPGKPPWIRVMSIAGIYDSGFMDFDENFVLGDLRHIQKMNSWNDDEVGGFELIIDDFDELEQKNLEVYTQTSSTLNSQSIVEKYPAIFEWISLFDNNIYVIISIMILVAGINMITALLVLILERTQMIGILKALGSNNLSVRKVFLYNAGYLIVRGLFWGNAIGLLVLLAQKYLGVITLNPETYYVNQVPVYLDAFYIILLNIGTLMLCMAMLIIPSIVVTRISPAQSIKFE